MGPRITLRKAHVHFRCGRNVRARACARCMSICVHLHAPGDHLPRRLAVGVRARYDWTLRVACRRTAGCRGCRPRRSQSSTTHRRAPSRARRRPAPLRATPCPTSAPPLTMVPTLGRFEPDWASARRRAFADRHRNAFIPSPRGARQAAAPAACASSARPADASSFSEADGASAKAKISEELGRAHQGGPEADQPRLPKPDRRDLDEVGGGAQVRRGARIEEHKRAIETRRDGWGSCARSVAPP